MKVLKTPLIDSQLRKLKAGDFVAISGTVVTARDRAYARIVSGQKLPVDMKSGVVYHCGPIVKRSGKKVKIISAGPTTSGRMDEIQVRFLKRTGVKAIIGKGGVNETVAKNLKNLGCVYLAFTGGAGVLAASFIKKIERNVWSDLGDAESVWVLKVENFGPLVVAIDLRGKNLYSRK